MSYIVKCFSSSSHFTFIFNQNGTPSKASTSHDHVENEVKEEGDEEEDDDEDDGDLSKYDLSGWGDESPAKSNEKDAADSQDGDNSSKGGNKPQHSEKYKTVYMN